MLDKDKVLNLTRHMDRIADRVQDSPSDFGFSKKEAYQFCLSMDTVADRLEQKADIDRRSETLEMEEDEPYMEDFNESGPSEMDEDEPYMEDFSNPDEDKILDQAPDVSPMNDGDLEVETFENDWDLEDEEVSADNLDEDRESFDNDWDLDDRTSSSNWYEDSKREASSNWYEDSKEASSDSDNWYDREATSWYDENVSEFEDYVEDEGLSNAYPEMSGDKTASNKYW